MFSIFKKKRPAREIYFHEDDYCQQQLLPAYVSNTVHKMLDEVAGTNIATAEASGWSEMTVRNESSLTLSALEWDIRWLEKTMDVALPRYTTVYSGYGSQKIECKFVGAWGEDDGCTVFADWDKNGRILSVWSSFFDVKEENARKFLSVLQALATDEPLLYVDWAWGYSVSIEDENSFVSRIIDKCTTIQSRHQSSFPTP